MTKKLIFYLDGSGDLAPVWSPGSDKAQVVQGDLKLKSIDENLLEITFLGEKKCEAETARISQFQLKK